jgi:hypothetical protein
VGLASGSVAPVPLKGGFFNRGARFELPKSYVRYFDSEQLTQAMSADGMFIKLQRFPNYDSGDASFWSRLAKRVLMEQRSGAQPQDGSSSQQTALTAQRSPPAVFRSSVPTICFRRSTAAGTVGPGRSPRGGFTGTG